MIIQTIVIVWGFFLNPCQVHGHEAVGVSDYAIAEFRGLPRLLFVHGAWNSIRVARMVSFFFYKNIVFYLTELW